MNWGQFLQIADRHPSLHCVLLTRREVHSKVGNVAGFNAEHLGPRVLSRVGQFPCLIGPWIPYNGRV